MPMLLVPAGAQAPADIPPPGIEANGVTTVDGGGGTENPGWVGVNNQRVDTTNPHPDPIELRVPGTEAPDHDRSYAPAWTFQIRPDTTDADWWLVNPGLHVEQQPGAAIPSGAMGPQNPTFGNTYRLEPTPADTGWYTGAGPAGL